MAHMARPALLLMLALAAAQPAQSQRLLDRVLARVNDVPVTLSDVRAALGMGLIVAREDELDLATEQLVQRTLLLIEVDRFPPPEPPEQAVDDEEARLRGVIGASLTALREGTGLDERQIRQSARDTLRIRAYLDQRFGDIVQVGDDEVRAYYAAHPDEFTRAGVLVPFDLVEADARQRAADARRQGTIDQWITDLRQRADVIVVR